MKKYIHYGSSSFNPYEFSPIENREHFNKPFGGLWASPCEPNNIGWKEWCEDNDFKVDSLQECFIFSISENANIYKIKTISDVDRLYNMTGIHSPLGDDFKCFDFELLEKMGYDGIEIEINSVDIYFDMYGWDVDSILIFNPEIIIEEK